MPIRYALYENTLTSDPNDYSAMVQPSGTADLAAIAQRIQEQDAALTQAEILRILEAEARAIESLLLEGWRVNLPAVSLVPRIRGDFAGANDSFTPERHQLDAVANPAPRLRELLQTQAQVTKIEANKPEPILLEFTDISSSAVNSTLTPGGIGRVRGNQLTFDPKDPQQGIFLRSNGRDLLRINFVATNKPGELVFSIPSSLKAGAYRLEVRTILPGCPELCSGALESALTVA